MMGNPLRACVLALPVLLGIRAALAAEPADVPPPDDEERRIAEVLLEFLSPDDESYAFTWDSVTVRTRSANWHLADPGDDERDPVYFRRVGWTEYPGGQSWVTACGTAETVMVATVTGSGSFSFGDENRRVLDPRILAALEAKGATAEEISRAPDSATHRISMEGRLAGVLDQLRVCGNPESAAVLPCETRYILVLDATKLDEAEELRGRCDTPGIWW